jgi:hypothetical protein
MLEKKSGEKVEDQELVPMSPIFNKKLKIRTKVDRLSVSEPIPVAAANGRKIPAVVAALNKRTLKTNKGKKKKAAAKENNSPSLVSLDEFLDKPFDPSVSPAKRRKVVAPKISITSNRSVTLVKNTPKKRSMFVEETPAKQYFSSPMMCTPAKRSWQTEDVMSPTTSKRR